MGNDHLLRTTEAGLRIGYSAQTLRNKRVKGEGPPFVKLGGAVRYRCEDLDAWVAARLRTSTSQVAA